MRSREEIEAKMEELKRKREAISNGTYHLLYTGSKEEKEELDNLVSHQMWALNWVMGNIPIL